MRPPNTYVRRDVRKGVGLILGPDRHGVLLTIGHVAYDPASGMFAVWYRATTHADVRRAYPTPGAKR